MSSFNSDLTPEKLVQHAYHDVVIVQYGDHNTSLECNDCNELLADTDDTVAVMKELGIYKEDLGETL